jgi:hypothetical protein
MDCIENEKIREDKQTERQQRDLKSLQNYGGYIDRWTDRQRAK